jgi:hypothetical protein
MFFRHFWKIKYMLSGEHNRAQLQEIRVEYEVRLFLTLINRSWALSRDQRVMNDLYRTRLSCGRIIRLLAHPPSPSAVSKLSLFLSLPMCRRSSLLTGEKGGGVGVEQNHATALYKSSCTLWSWLFVQSFPASEKKVFTVTSHPRPNQRRSNFLRKYIIVFTRYIWAVIACLMGLSIYSLFSILNGHSIYSLFPIFYPLFSIHYSLFSVLCSLFSILYSLFSILLSLSLLSLHHLYIFLYLCCLCSPRQQRCSWDQQAASSETTAAAAMRWPARAAGRRHIQGQWDGPWHNWPSSTPSPGPDLQV